MGAQPPTRLLSRTHPRVARHAISMGVRLQAVVHLDQATGPRTGMDLIRAVGPRLLLTMPTAMLQLALTLTRTTWVMKTTRALVPARCAPRVATLVTSLA